MRLRKEELLAMKALIDAEYEDEDAYIQAVWNGVIDLLGERNSYGVAVRFGETRIAYGPFYDVRRAKKYGGLFAGACGATAYIAPLMAPEKLKPKDV